LVWLDDDEDDEEGVDVGFDFDFVSEPLDPLDPLDELVDSVLDEPSPLDTSAVFFCLPLPLPDPRLSVR
jgi:hypothetical protein